MPEEAAEPASSNQDANLAASMAAFDALNLASAEPVNTPEQAKPAEKAPAPEAKPDAKPESGIPEEFLAPKKQEQAPPEDDFEALVKERPQGQVKHDHFAKLQAAADRKVKALMADLDKARAEAEKRNGNHIPEETAAELKQLRETLAQRETLLERVAFEQSPKFMEQFGRREESLREQALSIGKEYGVAEDLIADIIGAKGKRRDALVDDLEISDGAKRRLDAHLVNLDHLRSDREAALAKSREELMTLRQQEAADRKAQQEQERAEEDRVFNEALTEAKSKLPSFQRIDGNENWNKAVSEREQFAKNFFNGGATMKEMAELALLGMDHRVMTDINKTLRERLQAASDQIARLTAASPGGGHPPGYKPDTSGMTPEQLSMAAFEAALPGR